jgi:hypothetical protein
MPLFSSIKEARSELTGTSLLYKLGLYRGLHRLVWPVMRHKACKLLMRRVLPVKLQGMETYLFASNAAARSGSLKNVIEDQHSEKDLADLRVPTTLVLGTKDRAVYLKNLRHINLTDSIKVLQTNTGHHTVIENLKLSAELLHARPSLV